MSRRYGLKEHALTMGLVAATIFAACIVGIFTEALARILFAVIHVQPPPTFGDIAAVAAALMVLGSAMAAMIRSDP